ncbi:hypothetical protein AZE42_00127 [Rhizopogon vesiculosus]|uniref:Tethering factor for nuclear proteasome STS1 n=1 Tax=Rhizopogon vesiculosus TaxID=180088 RepID=A0A1J8Q6J2_9AGAM|nr:hypothetical protein AZE42_00127 [Rhizopogon vesiculosus]
MANVVHPPLDFLHNSATHSPSCLGFGFGGTSWQSTMTLGHTQPATFQQLASSMNLPAPVHRVQKRRHEDDESDSSGRHGARDIAMDRSPTPERSKRAAPKRAKVTSAVDSKDDKNGKENSSVSSDNDVDVGVLLASLPPQSLLPLLNAMISAQPSLKSLILPLIPRPTLDTAVQALEHSARKLREAYPYSNVSSFVPGPSTTTSFSFASGITNYRTNIGGPPSGFGRPDHQSQSGTSDGGMRESYILSRLRPAIHEFVSACMSYVPYFSYASSSLPLHVDSGSSQSLSTALQLQHKDKSHPSETFIFLSTLSNQILSQPFLTQSSLAPLLLPRLIQEWRAWIDRIDEVVNQQGGMFGVDTVRSWEKGLDEFAEAKGPEGWQDMRKVRNQWVVKVGWLVGRNAPHLMEEGL